MITLRTIDAHVAGAAVRLVVDGMPAPVGRSMLDKRDWAEQHLDGLRRLLMLEPRGHRDLMGAFLTEPVTPESHAGILFMDSGGFGLASVPAVMATTEIALRRGLLMPGGDGSEVAYDTPAGPVRVRVFAGEGDGPTVRVLNVPAFVLLGGVPVHVGGASTRQIRADVAFGGEFYAIVDSEAAGLSLDAAHVPELRRVGTAIARAIDQSHAVAHPFDPRLGGVKGTIFTGPSMSEAAQLRVVMVTRNAQVDRSPCGTGMSAIMAVLHAMGLLPEDVRFECEGLVETRMVGRIDGRRAVDEYDGIVVEIEGSAWITGDHTFTRDDNDPFDDGFLV